MAVTFNHRNTTPDTTYHRTATVEILEELVPGVKRVLMNGRQIRPDIKHRTPKVRSKPSRTQKGFGS